MNASVFFCFLRLFLGVVMYPPTYLPTYLPTKSTDLSRSVSSSSSAMGKGNRCRIEEDRRTSHANDRRLGEVGR